MGNQNFQNYFRFRHTLKGHSFTLDGLRKHLSDGGYLPSKDSTDDRETWHHPADPELTIRYNPQQQKFPIILINDQLHANERALIKNSQIKVDPFVEAKKVLERTDLNDQEKLEILKQITLNMDGMITSNGIKYPELRFQMTLPSGDFEKRIAFLLQGLEKLTKLSNIYGEKREALSEQYGVNIEGEIGVVLVSSKSLGYEKYIDPGTGNLQQHPLILKMDKLANELNELEKQRLKKLEALKTKGFYFHTVKEHEQLKLIIEHSNPGWPAQTASLCGTKGLLGLEALALIEKAEEAAAIWQSKPAVELPPTPILPVENRQASLESPPVELIIDNSTLKYLTTPRSNGRTWLDTLILASELPTVKGITLLAYTIDWERLGRVPLNQKGQMNLKQIDQNASQGLAFNITKNFTGDIGRVSLNAEEQPIQVGKYPKIRIVTSPEQEKYFEALFKIADQNKNPSKLKEALSQYRTTPTNEMGGKDTGENLILDYARSRAGTSPLYILANDFKFTFPQSIKITRNKLTTAEGAGIGLATFLGFIASLDAAYDGKLAYHLNQRFGGEESKISLEKLTDEINQRHPVNDRMQFTGGLPKVIPGNNREGKSEPLLETYFRQGINLQRQQANGKFMVLAQGVGGNSNPNMQI